MRWPHSRPCRVQSRAPRGYVGRMLTFSSNGPEAEKQMRAVIFYLTTFGYIDGDFDAAEKDFVRGYVKKLVAHRVASAGLDAKLSAELNAKFTTHFLEVFESIDRQVMDL